jgi:hypothetical protein
MRIFTSILTFLYRAGNFKLSTHTALSEIILHTRIISRFEIDLFVTRTLDLILNYETLVLSIQRS